MLRPTPGAIVMAVYEPDPELFRRQIRSIAAQTIPDFICVISPDSDPAPIRALLDQAAPGDERFTIVDTGGERLGFYLNFERGLLSVPPETEWVALADQDDWWYPEKLEVLLPHLATYGMVSGQARLVQYPSGAVLGTTERRNGSLERLMLSNQFTGSLSVLRREVLELALPFPRLSTRAAAHDHWLAVCAAATSGTHITSDVVQDYVQHSANVFGDPTSMPSRPSVLQSWRNARKMSRSAEGGDGVLAVVRTTFNVYVGWRQAMTVTLARRRDDAASLDVLERSFGSRRRLRALVPNLRAAVRDGYVPRGFALQYLASWMCGTISPRRRRR